WSRRLTAAKISLSMHSSSRSFTTTPSAAKAKTCEPQKRRGPRAFGARSIIRVRGHAQRNQNRAISASLEFEGCSFSVISGLRGLKPTPISRREWRLVLVFALALAVVTTLPYVVAVAAQGSDWLSSSLG